jgi:hypothetical protein
MYLYVDHPVLDGFLYFLVLSWRSATPGKCRNTHFYARVLDPSVPDPQERALVLGVTDS